MECPFRWVFLNLIYLSKIKYFWCDFFHFGINENKYWYCCIAIYKHRMSPSALFLYRPSYVNRKERSPLSFSLSPSFSPSLSSLSPPLPFSLYFSLSLTSYYAFDESYLNLIRYKGSSSSHFVIWYKLLILYKMGRILLCFTFNA